MENKTKKHVDALKSLHLSNKINGIKQTESIFPQNQFNDLIIDKLKEIKQLQNNINLDNNIYNIQHKEKNIMFLINIHYLLLFNRYTQGKFGTRRCWWRTKHVSQKIKWSE